MVLLQRRLCFSKELERVIHFPGGGGGGGGGGGVVGVQRLISIEFDRTCDLPGVRVRTPFPLPLDLHVHDI